MTKIRLLMRPSLGLIIAMLLLGGIILLYSGTGQGKSLAFESSPTVRESMGVNIHFTGPRPGEMKMLSEGGFRWVRMDLAWAGVERSKSEYDFSHYDRLFAALEPYGIHALMILDYVNPLYDSGVSPFSRERRSAFYRWAVAAVRRYQGRGALWEMYNEPNLSWKPRPDAKGYCALALELGRELRKTAPSERYIGPAVNQMDFPFLEECFRAGLLEYWTFVSVHPYRKKLVPETVASDFERLSSLIAKYAPKGKHIAPISSEWGYTVTECSEEKQGWFLPRMVLSNLMCRVPLSIWYDWHDDGTMPGVGEHNFGTVRNRYFEGRDPVYDSKPAYRAARTLARELGDFRFEKRLTPGGVDDYVLQFRRGREVRLACWTSAVTQGSIKVPLQAGGYAITEHLDERNRAVKVGEEGLTLTLTQGPVYLKRQ